METIADVVRRARLARGMTQEQLEEAIGKSGGYIGKLEAGKVNRPLNPTLRALARVLQVPQETLVAATGQLDVSEEDPLEQLVRAGSLPRAELRVAAFRELPSEVRTAVVVLMRDLFQMRLQELGEVDQ
jgi:transcriptional regulator with XRE-family HTH domain